MKSAVRGGCVAGERMTILLTGATGQVGGTVLGELLESGCRVICIARARGGRSAEQRVRETLELVGRDPNLDFEVFDGELTRRDLGLAPDALRRLAGVDRIIHSAARVAFEVVGRNEPFETNVGGTHLMLELARNLGGVPFTHVSTAYVCGQSAGLAPEAVSVAPPAFRNPYEASKWKAEQLVHAAGRAGLPVRICRPSIIVGGANDGRAVHFQGFYLICRALSTMCQIAGHDRMGAEELILDDLDVPGALDGPINLVTADFVGAAVAHIGALGPEVGGVYHLTHPSPPTLGELCDMLSAFYRLQLPCIDARRPRPRAVRAVTRVRVDTPRLRRRERLLARASQQFWRFSEPVRPYFSETPLFDTRAARALLEPLDIRPAAIDGLTLQRMLEYAEQTGYGKGRKAAAPA